jgi:hypothetical protein
MAEREVAVDSGGMTGWYEWLLIAWGLAFNLVWEFEHSPLYIDHAKGAQYVFWTRVHCSVGDVLILLGAFWATGAIYQSRRWPGTRGNRAAATFVGLGLAYTAWSEWFNTSVREAWAYAPAMPRVFGVGLSPLFQWLVLPTLLVFILRFSAGRSVLTGERR